MASTTVESLTIEELVKLSAIVPLVTAGKAWGIGRSKSAELARADQFPCPEKRIPVLTLGRKHMVRKVDLMRSLGLNLDGTPLEASPEPGAA